MHKAFLTPILLIISYLAVAQEKVFYDVNAQKREVSGVFHSIRVSDGINLYLSQSDTEGVVVSATEVQYRDKIKTVVEDGVLNIDYGNVTGWNWNTRQLKVYVAVKSIKVIRATGGSDVFVQGVLAGEELSMKFSGGSDFKGAVAVTNLTVEQSGGSDVRIKGKAVNVKVEASGGSDFKGYDLLADYAIIQASGGSDADITVTKEIAADATGGSDINYKGKPVIKYQSGSVTGKGK